MLVTDESDEDDVPRADTDPSEDWVDSIAAAEGVPPEEVMERLVSSYWTLTEVSEMLSGTEGNIGLGAAGDIDPWTGGVIEDSEDASTVEDTEDVSTVEDSEEDSIVENIQELSERLDRLEEELHAQQESHADLETDFGKLTQRMDAVEGQLRERQDSIESRLNVELENLETILSYLIDTTDKIDRDLNSILEEWATIQDSQAEAEGLADLKRTASQLGVQSGECEHCGSSVDIGVLPTADCPDCGGEFVDIEPATGWFGMGTDTLITAEETDIETSAVDPD